MRSYGRVFGRRFSFVSGLPFDEVCAIMEGDVKDHLLHETFYGFPFSSVILTRDSDGSASYYIALRHYTLVELGIIGQLVTRGDSETIVRGASVVSGLIACTVTCFFQLSVGMCFAFLLSGFAFPFLMMMSALALSLMAYTVFVKLPRDRVIAMLKAKLHATNPP